MSYTPPNKPDGPWSTPQLVPSPTPGDTNMACVINATGGLFCAGRPGLGTLTAYFWKNLSSYSSWTDATTESVIGEDPMVWLDARGGVHMVTHGGGWESPFGYHYWSTFVELEQGLPFHANNAVKAYENIVQVVDAPARNLSRRERPHVVLGKDGLPIALTNGVTEAWPCTLTTHPVPGSNGTTILCPIDYCWTLAQPLVGWREHV
eukprot:1845221-Prymnesium_polylepis.1